MMDFDKFAQIVMGHVSAAIDPVVDALVARIDQGLLALRAEFDEKLAALPAPRDGTSVAVDDVMVPLRDAVKDEVTAAAASAFDGSRLTMALSPVLAQLKLDLEESARAEVAAAVAAIPAPKDGASVVVDDVLPAIRDAVVAAVAAESMTPLAGERLSALVSPMVERAKGELAQSLRHEIKEAVAALPPAKDGASISVDDVTPVIREAVRQEVAQARLELGQASADAVSAAIAALPAPKDGTSVSVEDVMPELLRELDARVAAIPTPKDGESPSAEAIAAAFEPKLAAWALDFERRAQGVLERAVDRVPRPKDGADGRDGADGLGFDHLSCEYDGDRRVVLRFVAGDRVKEFAIDLPIVLDRGVFKEGGNYWRNDGVTYGGSWWIAQVDGPSGKPGTSDDWRLAVKRGRDGRDGRDGIDKTAPVKVS